MTALDHRVIVKELPRTKQAHLIRLDSGTLSMLRKVRAEQAETNLRIGVGDHDDGYLFCQPDRKPYHPERVLTRVRSQPALPQPGSGQRSSSRSCGWPDNAAISSKSLSR